MTSYLGDISTSVQSLVLKYEGRLMPVAAFILLVLLLRELCSCKRTRSQFRTWNNWFRRRFSPRRESINERPSQTTDTSSLSLSEAESVITDNSEDDDDLLEAVSLLFQDDDANSEDLDGTTLIRDTGSLVARIIPRDRIGYETKKASVFQYPENVDKLRTLAEATSGIPIGEPTNIDKDLDWRSRELADKVVVIEVQLSLTPQSLKNVTVRNRFKAECKKVEKRKPTTLRLKRDANESARCTLRRLHVSIAKRLGCTAHGGSLYLRSKGVDHDCLQREYLPNEPSVWVRDSSSLPETQNEVDLSVQVQRPFKLGTDVQSSSEPTGTMHEINSAELWNKLADFEESNLYFGIHSSGPLLPLQVDACPPTILEVGVFESFQSRLYVGVPIAISPQAIHATHCLVAWFIEDTNGRSTCISSEYFPASEAFSSCTPAREDVGKFLSVLVVPTRPNHRGKSCESAYKFYYAIEDLPPMPIVSPFRDNWTRKRSQESSSNLRVVTYNLLADWYAGRTVEAHGMSQRHPEEANKSSLSPEEPSSSNHNKGSSRTHSFYNYCDSAFLLRNRRFPMLLAEILSYEPDIVCLQEVDSFVFEYLLLPALRSRGYQGFFSSKTVMQTEGCAMFWSLRVFGEAGATDMQEFPLRDFGHVRNNGNASYQANEDCAWKERSAPIRQLNESNSSLHEMMTSKLGQIVQVAALHPRCSGREMPKAIVVGNTHLFYHPLADHIRSIQAFHVCRRLDAIRRQVSKGTGSVPLVLCGDLNSNPLSGAVQLLLQGRLGPEHPDAWKYLREYTWDMGGEEYLLEHGYLGDSQDNLHDDDDDDDDPNYVNESFMDAKEKESENWGGGASQASRSQPEGLELQFPATFPPLTSGYPELPSFTNYSVGFAETFDYIFISESSPNEEFGFRSVDSAPIPSAEEMKKYGPMPNEFQPSDHFSLVCDLEWTKYHRHGEK